MCPFAEGGAPAPYLYRSEHDAGIQIGRLTVEYEKQKDVVFPSLIPGVHLSDHRSFAEVGIPALMVTDTAFYRDPKYHLPTDTAGRLNYEQMARVVSGLSRAVSDLCREKL